MRPLVLGLLLTAIPGRAEVFSKTIVLPPLTVSPTENIRVNLLSGDANYPGWSPYSVCQVVTTFYGADGSVVAEPKTVTISKTNEVFSIELPYASIGSHISPAVLNGEIKLIPIGTTISTLSPPLPPCALVFSVDIFDGMSGVSHLLMTGQTAVTGKEFIAETGPVSILPCLDGSLCDLIYAFEKTPARVMVLPPISLTSTETLQVDIRSAPVIYSGSSADTCAGSVSFFGADGSLIGSPFAFTLKKAAGSFSGKLPGNTSRAMVSTQLSLTALPIALPISGIGPLASAVLPCITVFSVKTVDTTTGIVHGYISGHSVPPEGGSNADAAMPVRRGGR